MHREIIHSCTNLWEVLVSWFTYVILYWSGCVLVKISMVLKEIIRVCLYIYGLLFISNYNFKNNINILDNIILFWKAPELRSTKLNLSEPAIIIII